MPSPPAAILGQNRAHRAAIVDELRRRLPRMESAATLTRTLPFGLATLDAHLPQGGLTVGALHEIAPQTPADTPAAFGFLAALLARFVPPSRPLLLVATSRAFADHGRPHGHGLSRLGFDPARLILVETKAEKQALWAMEEALRSAVPAAVAGMVARLDLKSSQRLHLAAEAARDRVGLIMRAGWKVTLERCRNGRPGEWLVEFDHAAYRFSLAAPLADPALSRHPAL